TNEDLTPLRPAAAAINDKRPTTNDKRPTTNDKREKPPGPAGSHRVSKKKIQEFKLANGLKVVLVEDRRLPFIKTRLLFPNVIASEAKQSHGDADRFIAVSDALADLFKSGTSKRDSAKIESELAALGASLGASAGKDNIMIGGSVLTETATPYFELLTEILTDSVFPEKEAALWRVNTVEELKDERTMPKFLRDERWSRELFGDHPYGTIAPKPETIKDLKREEILELYRRQYDPRQGTLIIVGDIAKGRLKKLLNSTVGKLPPPLRRSAAPPLRRNFPPPPSQRKIVVVDRPGSTQSSIIVGHRTIKRTDPDYYRLVVLNAVLGTTFDSRLNRNLREEKGYTYGIGSGLEAFWETGVFRAAADVRTEVTADALKEIFSEIAKIRESGIEPDELDLARNYLAGSDAIRLGYQDQVAEKLAVYRALGLPSKEINRFREKIFAVTKGRAQAAGRKYLHPEHLTGVVVGDAAKIAEFLTVFGEIVIYNQDGTKRGEPNET
ncbi:MAG: insulinase family protein, partial [Elusimicrobia bacterium]|nr:insulinase family protein [Elusimicrobiota bacterium]